MDIIVTTPKSEMVNAAKEAANARDAIDSGTEVCYFRRFAHHPPTLHKWDKVFYVEDGYIRGYAVVDRIEYKDEEVCSTTGRTWSQALFAYMKADSWTWIKPIPLAGFRGWRKMLTPFEIVGDWKDPRPSA